MCLCWSRTEILRCSCSRIVGSWVWKPGDKHAIPTSCIARPLLSLAVKGAEGRDDCVGWLWEVLDKSNLRGRCREVLGTSGEDGGSFLTIILGGPCLDELGERFPSGVTFCWAGPSLSTTGTLPEAVLVVAEVRSAWAGALFDGAIVGYDDLGLTSGSAGGGASGGGAAADATAVLIVSEYKRVEYQVCRVQKV